MNIFTTMARSWRSRAARRQYADGSELLRTAEKQAKLQKPNSSGPTSGSLSHSSSPRDPKGPFNWEVLLQTGVAGARDQAARPHLKAVTNLAVEQHRHLSAVKEHLEAIDQVKTRNHVITTTTNPDKARRRRNHDHTLLPVAPDAEGDVRPLKEITAEHDHIAASIEKDHSAGRTRHRHGVSALNKRMAFSLLFVDNIVLALLFIPGFNGSLNPAAYAEAPLQVAMNTVSAIALAILAGVSIAVGAHLAGKQLHTEIHRSRPKESSGPNTDPVFSLRSAPLGVWLPVGVIALMSLMVFFVMWARVRAELADNFGPGATLAVSAFIATAAALGPIFVAAVEAYAPSPEVIRRNQLAEVIRDAEADIESHQNEITKLLAAAESCLNAARARHLEAEADDRIASLAAVQAILRIRGEHPEYGSVYTPLRVAERAKSSDVWSATPAEVEHMITVADSRRNDTDRVFDAVPLFDSETMARLGVLIREMEVRTVPMSTKEDVDSTSTPRSSNAKEPETPLI